MSIPKPMRAVLFVRAPHLEEKHRMADVQEIANRVIQNVEQVIVGKRKSVQLVLGLPPHLAKNC